MKKIISYLVIVCILLSMGSPAFAENAPTEYDRQLLSTLKGLKILPEMGEDSFVPERQMYTGDYLNGLLNIMGDYGYFGTGMTTEAKETAYALGLIDETFDSQFSAITLQDAIAYSLGALGYNAVLSVKDYPFLSVSRDLKEGIDAKDTDVLTQSQAMTLLYNTAFAEPLEQVMWKDTGEVERVVARDVALIYTTRKIYKVEGAVTKTSITSLDGALGCDEDRIAIGDKIYYCPTNAYDDYLGYGVDAYVQEKSNGMNQLLHLEKKADNKEVLISKDMFVDVSDNCRQLTYWKDESGQRTLKLAPALKLIYNGRCVLDYKKSDFMINQGSITLIDRNKDNIYETVKISAQETMVVDTISTNTQTLFGKFTYTGSLNKLVLDEDESTIVIKKFGEIADFEDIKAGDVLTVLRSKDTTDKYIQVTISSDTISGELNASYPDDKLYVDETEYERTYDLMQAGIKSDKMYQALKLGAEYTFYLDAEGRIAYAELLSESEERMGLLYKLALDPGNFSDTVYLRIFDTKGTWSTYTLAKKPVINNARKDTVTEAHGLISGKEGTIIKFYLNAEGEIKKLETATEASTYIPNTFLCSASSSENYYTGDRAFNGNYFVDEKTILITRAYIPTGQTESEADYMIQSYSSLGNNNAYEYQAYGLNEFNRAEVVYIKYNQSNADTGAQLANLFVVTGAGTVLDNGEEVKVLMGNYGKNADVTIKEEFVSLDGIQPGEILSVSLDSNNYVRSLTKRHTATDTTTVSFPANLYVNIALVQGRVDKIDPTAMYLRLTDGNTTFKNYRWLNSNNVTVNIYYKDTQKAEVATVADIEKGDYVLVRYNRNSMKDIVVIRDN